MLPVVKSTKMMMDTETGTSLSFALGLEVVKINVTNYEDLNLFELLWCLRKKPLSPLLHDGAKVDRHEMQNGVQPEWMCVKFKLVFEAHAHVPATV